MEKQRSSNPFLEDDIYNTTQTCNFALMFVRNSLHRAAVEGDHIEAPEMLGACSVLSGVQDALYTAGEQYDAEATARSLSVVGGGHA